MRCNSSVIGDKPPPPRVTSRARAASRTGDAPLLAGDEPPSPICHQSTSRPPGERCREEDDSALNSKASFRRHP
ncbi:hypothetical protein BDA96_10G207700 [Sorghum bicolor]|uniref:Uncharacterized protein n=1 Tax=Sorghum bicolor TaxID=4558 RepID=A0A921Q6B4_SORBI|nr:hypothetical protein BDA96_10G207700 [Sorghum bicolor]